MKRQAGNWRGLFSLVVMALAVIILPQMAQAFTIDIQAYIDGRDQLIIKGNTVQWEHFDYAAVGRHDGHNYPTKLKTAAIDEAWVPQWPEPVPAEIRYHAFSSIFTGLSPFLPQAPVIVTLTNLTNPLRGPVTIVQSPQASNDYTLKVEFNDNDSYPGWYAAWYTVELNIVPLPGSVLLLGPSLAGLLAWRWRRS